MKMTILIVKAEMVHQSRRKMNSNGRIRMLFYWATTLRRLKAQWRSNKKACKSRTLKSHYLSQRGSTSWGAKKVWTRPHHRSDLAYREAKVQFIVVHEAEARVWFHLSTPIRFNFAKETRKQLPSWLASRTSRPEMSCLWSDSHPSSLIKAWDRHKSRRRRTKCSSSR